MSQLSKISKSHMCIGCGICKNEFNDSIDLHLDSNGKFDIDATSWNKEKDLTFSRLCPECNTGNSSLEIWGTIHKSWYGWSNNEEYRRIASSGGVITEIASYLLERKKVDAILHIKRDPNNPIKNIYTVTTTQEELIDTCGSRYAPSSLLLQLDEVLQDNTLAVIGKPCDIRALNNYLAEHPNLSKKIVYKISMFCGGVPSENATLSMLKKMNVRSSDIIEMSYRGNGWPGYATVTEKSGKISSMSYEESWGKILGRNIHRCCKVCVDGLGEGADINCGDGWYDTDKGYPKGTYGDGRNIIITRNKNGTDLIEEMILNKKITTEFIGNAQKELERIQPGQYSRKIVVLPRILAMKVCGIFTPRYSFNELVSYSKGIGFVYGMRVFLGTLKRIIRGKL